MDPAVPSIRSQRAEARCNRSNMKQHKTRTMRMLERLSSPHVLGGLGRKIAVEGRASGQPPLRDRLPYLSLLPERELLFAGEVQL